MAKPKRKPQAANPTANVRRYLPALAPGSMGQRFAGQQTRVTSPSMAPGSMGQRFADQQQPKPVATPIPGAPTTATTAPTPGLGASTIQDPSFLAWQAQRQNEINQTKAGYDAADQSESLARAEALRRLGTQKPTDVRKTSESFNKAGLFYSGQLGRAQDDLQANYLQREGDVNSRFDASAASRRAARQALDQGYPLEVAAQLAAAADRKISADSAAADEGVLAPPTEVASAISPAKVRPALHKLAKAKSKKGHKR
jgi:hypothetical protein